MSVRSAKLRRVVFLPLLLCSIIAEAAQSDSAAKMRGWVGERIILLDRVNYPPNNPWKFFAEGNQGCFHRFGNEKAWLPVERYAGKTGTVSDAILLPPWQKPVAVITLDGAGERIVGCSDGYLGFFAELEQAKKLVADIGPKTLWVRGGALLLVPPGTDINSARDRAVQLQPLTPVTAVRAEWGLPFGTIVLYFRDAQGREGGLPLGRGRAMDPRFHLEETAGSLHPFRLEDYFFREDPKALEPKWSEAIWLLIARQEIAVGMTEAMVQVACGRALEPRGVILKEDGTTAQILRCKDTQFVLDQGKVTRYANPREGR